MVRVESCRFLRLGCSAEVHPLFRREYIRSNRERGVKLLRCFPHCCPEHVKRSYCGCSVHVLVTFSTDVSALQLDDIVVCARFEPSRVAPLWPESLAELARNLGAPAVGDEDTDQEKLRLDVGETVPLPAKMVGDQGEGKGEVWMRAERESDEQRLGLPKKCILYSLNNDTSPKWFYSYDSSVTRTQREMTHHLVVYTFRLQSANTDISPLHANSSGYRDALVLARHASPGFLLASYRRYRATEIPVNNENDVVPEKRVKSPLPWQQRQRQPCKEFPAERCDFSACNGCRDRERRLTGANDSAISDDIDVDSSLWQRQADALCPGFLEKCQHLLILWRFLQCVSLGDAGIDSGSISHLCSSWLHVADALRFSKPSTGDQVEDTIGALLKEVFTPPAISSQSEWPSRRSAIIAMTAYLLIRTQLSCTVQRIVRSFVKVEKDTASESQLRGHFVLLVSHIYDYVSGVLREACGVQPGKSDTCGSLPDLVDDVLSLVYGQARFVILRREMSALLMGQQSPGSLSDTLNSVFRLYRAQVLESHIRLGQHLIQQRCASSVTRLQNAWNHRWLLDPLTVRCNRVTSPGLDIVGIAQFIREFGCVDVEVEDNMSYLSVGSALSKLRDTSMMELVLDGRLRAYRELPSGLSGWSVGDYAAEFCDGGLDIDLFAIEGRKTEGRGSGERWLTRVCRIRLLLSLEQRVNSAMLSRNGRDMVVVVHGAILAATYLPPYSRGQSTGAEEFLQLSIEDRAAMYGSLEWTPLMETQAEYAAIA